MLLSHQDILAKGKSFFEKGDHQRAQVLFNEIIEADTKNATAFFYLANIFHLKGEIGKAIKAFTKVLEIDPAHTDAAISLSVLYNDIGRYEEAKKVFDRANERVKNKTHIGQGIEDQHINKKFSQKHFELAELYMSYGRYDESLFEYNKASALDSSFLEARVKIAKVYAKKGFISKAIEELKTLKNENPEYLPARVALGVIHYGNGNILEAQAEWQRVMAKDPYNPEAGMYLNLSSTATETNI
jgi:tetratricopeptide (TPR) repeat protein